MSATELPSSQSKINNGCNVTLPHVGSTPLPSCRSKISNAQRGLHAAALAYSFLLRGLNISAHRKEKTIAAVMPALTAESPPKND